MLIYCRVRFQPICVFIISKIDNFFFTISSYRRIQDPDPVPDLDPDPKFLIFNLRIRIRNYYGISDSEHWSLINIQVPELEP